MGRPKISSEAIRKRRTPARSPESREQQLVSYAIDLAEQQILAGTASSQVISHFLKIGSTKELLEKKKLEKENELLSARTEALKSAERVEELYKNALDAIRQYQPSRREMDEEDD